MIPPVNTKPIYKAPGSLQQNRLRFGAAVPDLGPVTNLANKFYRVVGSDPGLRILFLDLIAWCGIRTWIDYNRSWFLPDQIHRWLPFLPGQESKTPEQQKEATHKNPAAGLERMLREIGCTFTDVFSDVLVLIPTLPIVDKLWGLYSARFVSQNHLKYFQHIAESLAKQESIQHLVDGKERVKAFYREMGSQLAQSLQLTPEQAKDFQELFTKGTFTEKFAAQKGLRGTLNKTFPLNSLDMDALMEEVQKVTGKTEFDVKLTKDLESNLTDLLRDVAKISRRMERAVVPEGTTWTHYLANRLAKTVRFRKWLPLTLVISLAGNMLLPHIIQLITLKRYATERYPGEMGIAKDEKINFDHVSHHEKEQALKRHHARPWYERNFPYLSQSLKHGKILPLIPAVLLLPFMLGFYQLGGSGVKGLVKPQSLFKQPLASMRYWVESKMVLPEGLSFNSIKQWLRTLSQRMDYSSRPPHCSDQQQAATYATALFSRILTPRSSIEWRERTFDSLLSYWLGFMFTPAVEGKLANALDGKATSTLGKLVHKLSGSQTGKIQLLKSNGEMRSDYEILYGLKDKPAIQTATLKAKTWLNVGLLGFTAFLMGVFEPILSIYLTGLQSNWQAKKAQKPQLPSQSITPQPVAAQQVVLPLPVFQSVAKTAFQLPATLPEAVPFSPAFNIAAPAMRFPIV